MKTGFAALALGTLLASPLAAAGPGTRPADPLAPCKVPSFAQEMDARCGFLEVWENRAARTGRKLRLKVVVVPARGPNRQPDPVFFLAGGPGQAVTPGAGFYAGEEDVLLQERDMVFVDQRGTGEPGRLGCDLGTPGDLQSYLNEQFPIEAVRRCRAELEKRADLSFYGTDEAADDLEEARVWLGYGKINLIGGSYGTRLAQLYLKRHPESVRALVLNGPVPMDEAGPLSHAAQAQRAMDLLLQGCDQDEACRRAFPNVRSELRQILEQAGREPVRVTLPDPETGKPAEVRLGRPTLADGVRWHLYNPKSAAMLPLLIHEAARGNWTPLAEASVKSRLRVGKGIATGLFFSVSCSEDAPFIDPATIPQRTAGTFLGDDRVRGQNAACEHWVRAPIQPGQRDLFRSDAPVLIVSGERDPVTPPEFGERILRHLVNARQVIVPFGSHSDEGDCGGRIAAEFIRKGSTQGLDTSCLTATRPTPFLLELPGKP